MFSLWKKFRQLNKDERRLAVVAALILPPVALTLKIAGLHRARQIWGYWLPRHTLKIQESPLRRAQSHSTGRIVQSVGNRLGIHCLGRSVALWWLLAWQGIESRIVLGGRKEKGVFRAHAWVEVEGMVVGDRWEQVQKFERFTGEFDSGFGEYYL